MIFGSGVLTVTMLAKLVIFPAPLHVPLFLKNNARLVEEREHNLLIRRPCSLS